jgi:hypothetical protein
MDTVLLLDLDRRWWGRCRYHSRLAPSLIDDFRFFEDWFYKWLNGWNSIVMIIVIDRFGLNDGRRNIDIK